MSEDTLYIPNREEWRKWLEMNHDSKALVWLIYYKTYTGKTFNSLAPSYKLQFLGWIMEAKKEETRKKRLNEAIELLGSGKKLRMK